MQIEPSREDKRTALERVLRSETFSRSEQLRRFLRYVCETEMAGQAETITEYSIAVEALGRRPDYSPNDDSSVRNRAYALRKKLEEYYAGEGSSDPFRIVLPKGSYVPRYCHQAADTNLPAVVGGGFPPATEAAEWADSPPFPRKQWRLKAAAAFAAAVVVIAAAAFLLVRKPDPVDPVLREAWGPILNPQSNAALCVATPGHMFIRPYREGRQPTYLRLYEAPKEAYSNYRGRLDPDFKLYMLLTQNSPLWGDAIGVALASRLCGSAGASFELLPERLLSSVAALRNRNLVLFGTPEYSALAARLLEKAPLTVGFDEDAGEHAILDRRKTPPEALFLPDRDALRKMTHTWGLVTVLPSEGAAAGLKRTIVFSGISSAGTQAAIEFFTSPQHLNDLKARFQKTGRRGFPGAYQVVVETDVAETIPLKAHYKMHVEIALAH